MKNEKSLQKFTNTQKKIDKLLTLEQVTEDDLETFTDKERNCLTKTLTERFNELKGVERDKFYNKIEPIVQVSTKNKIWEYNHHYIIGSISKLLQQFGRMPTKTELADETDLSRQTIHKHLKEYSNHAQYLEHVEQFKIMSSQVLSQVLKLALQGDLKAAKLYFSLVDSEQNGLTQNNTLIQNQNNYIQINGTVLSQEKLKHLNPEQLNTIETIIKTALIQPAGVELDK